MTRFDIALATTLPEEGGFANRDRAADPGGRTQKGITQKTYDAYLANHKRPSADVKGISETDLKAIYHDEYWDMVNGDRLPAGLDTAVFDFAVHSGPDRAARVLQKLLAVKEDGQIGANTLAALPAEHEDLIDDYGKARLAFLKTLSNYAKNPGWVDRVSRVTAAADKQALAAEEPDTHPAPVFKTYDPLTHEVATEKADETKVQTSKTKPGIVGIIASASVVAPAVTTTATALQPYVSDSHVGQVILVVVAILTVVGGIFAGYNILKPYLKVS